MEMTLIELEQRLKRMREQGAEDATLVRIIHFGGNNCGKIERIQSVAVRICSGPMGKRVIELLGE